MKKMYKKPMAFEEAFVADEYVAACYFLACKRGNEEWTGNDDKWGGYIRTRIRNISFSIRNSTYMRR